MVIFSSFTFNLIFKNTVVQCENAFGMIDYIYSFINLTNHTSGFTSGFILESSRGQVVQGR